MDACVYLTWCKHTREFGRIWKYLFESTWGAPKKWPSLKIWLMWYNFYYRTEQYVKWYIFRMHVSRSVQIWYQILILIFGLKNTTFHDLTYVL